MTQIHRRIPLWAYVVAVLGLGFGGGGIATRMLSKPAPVVVETPPVVEAPPAVAGPPEAPAPQPATGLTADGVNDFGACDADATKLCSGVLETKGKLALVECLSVTHAADISAACDASLDRRQALNEAMVAACQQDKREHCKSVTPEPGSEPLVECLWSHSSELTVACITALQAHDAAKPI